MPETREINTPQVREALATAVHEALSGDPRVSAVLGRVFVILDRASAGLPLDAKAADAAPPTWAELLDHLEAAWGVIANAGSWPNMPAAGSPGWLDAAERWRDRWHDLMDADRGRPQHPATEAVQS